VRGHYWRSHDSVHLYGHVLLGAGFAVTGLLTVDLPVQAQTSGLGRTTGSGAFSDASSTFVYNAASSIASATQMWLYVAMGGQYFTTGSYPFTFVAGDEFWWSLTYPAL
jgi:hypothetical protein